MGLQSPLHESGKRDACGWLESSVRRPAEIVCERRQKEGATIKPGNLQIYDALINGAVWDNRGVLSTASKSIVLLAVSFILRKGLPSTSSVSIISGLRVLQGRHVYNIL